MTQTQIRRIARDIKRITGVNFLEKRRDTRYVEGRAFFIHILKNYYKFRNKDIIITFNDLGFKLDSATLCHSLKMFEIYEHNNPRMQSWFDILFAAPDYKNRDKTQAYIRSKLKYLPEDTLIKLAGQIKVLIENPELESENVEFHW
jgi:hypothetical protein